MQKLKEELKIDLELYDFVVQRFNAQLQYVTQNINFNNYVNEDDTNDILYLN